AAGLIAVFERIDSPPRGVREVGGDRQALPMLFSLPRRGEAPAASARAGRGPGGCGRGARWRVSASGPCAVLTSCGGRRRALSGSRAGVLRLARLPAAL